MEIIERTALIGQSKTLCQQMWFFSLYWLAWYISVIQRYTWTLNSHTSRNQSTYNDNTALPIDCNDRHLFSVNQREWSNSRFLRDHQVDLPMYLYNNIDRARFSLLRYSAKVWRLCYSLTELNSTVSVQTVNVLTVLLCFWMCCNI